MNSSEVPPSTPARERVLAAAERLFAEHGYAAVTLRDIAGALGMKQASLYHHAPGGKEQLFVEVMERGFARHRDGLAKAIAEGGDDLRRQLRRAATWLLSQPPLDMNRFLRSDLAALSPESAERLRVAAFTAMFGPIKEAIVAAENRGEVTSRGAGMVAGTFLAMMNGVELVRDTVGSASPEGMAEFVVDILLDGIRPR